MSSDEGQRENSDSYRSNVIQEQLVEQSPYDSETEYPKPTAKPLPQFEEEVHISDTEEDIAESNPPSEAVAQDEPAQSDSDVPITEPPEFVEKPPDSPPKKASVFSRPKFSFK
jgi:hypothetical protein